MEKKELKTSSVLVITKYQLTNQQNQVVERGILNVDSDLTSLLSKTLDSDILLTMSAIKQDVSLI